MPLRNAIPLTIKPAGVSDALDGTTAFPGAMAALSDLVLAPHTRNMWVPRPAALLAYNFSDFTAPTNVTATLVVGTRVYGMVSTGRNAGYDEPFIYDFAVSGIIAITGVTAANVPLTQPIVGDITQPQMEVVGSYIVVCHPGFPGGTGPFFGWFDLTGLNSTTITGNTHTSTTIDNLSANALQAGWTPGKMISGSGIPANTRIVSIAANGLSVVISNATTTTVSGTALTVTGGTKAAPLWAAGNTNGNPLTQVPVAVQQMAGAANYAVGSAVVESDSLNPVQVTNANQVVTFANNLPVTALGGTPFTNQLGGIVQSLIVFQSTQAVQQILGSTLLNNRSVNLISGAPGTLAPNSVTSMPQGLAYIAPDGLRLINQDGVVAEPIGTDGAGITVPFIYALTPTRIAAAWNEGVIRVACQNGNVSGNPMQEWWWDSSQNAWSGPHSFVSSTIEPYGGSMYVSTQQNKAALYTSVAQPTLGSTYVENGNAMSWQWQTVLLPDNSEMSMNAVVETALMLALAAGQVITVMALDEEGVVLNQITISGVDGVASIWGSSIWGSFLWGTLGQKPRQGRIPWTTPLIFKQMSVRITGPSAVNIMIGNLYLKYQRLDYLLEAS